MNNGNFFFFFGFFLFPSLFSKKPRGGGAYRRAEGCGMFTAMKEGEGVPTGRGGFQASSDRGGFPTPWWGTRKTGRGDDWEGGRLVMVADRS